MAGRYAMRWVVVLLFALLIATQGATVAQGPPGNEQFLRQVSEEHAIPLDRLNITDRLSKVYPSTGVRLYEAKVLDTATGDTYPVSLDAAGQPMDQVETETREQEAHRARFGKL